MASFLILAACAGSDGGGNGGSAPASGVSAKLMSGAWCHEYLLGDPQKKIREREVFLPSGEQRVDAREVETQLPVSSSTMRWSSPQDGRVELTLAGSDTVINFKPSFKTNGRRECYTVEDRRLNGKPEPKISGALPLQKCRCD